MKALKFSFIALSLLLISCKGDDSSSLAPILPIDIIPNISIEVDAILLLPPNSDITNFVNFGQAPGVPTSEWTVELNENDSFILGIPQSLPTGDKFMYSRVDFFDDSGQPVDSESVDTFLELVFPSDTEFIEDPNFPGFDVSSKWQYNVIGALDNTDVNYKYDIQCYIVRQGVFNGPYIIDPKIKINSSN